MCEKLAKLAADPHHALELGKAAEHLVCADLILSGYRAYLSDQGLPYDVVVDLSGRLLRVQVRSACFAKNINATGKALRLGYCFHVRRRGRSGSRRLTDRECDLVACVALDAKCAAYFPLAEVGQTIQLTPVGFEFSGRFSRRRWSAIDGFSFSDALARLDGALNPHANLGKLCHDGEYKSLTEWSRVTGISVGVISGRLSRGWTPEQALTRPPNKSFRQRENVHARH